MSGLQEGLNHGTAEEGCHSHAISAEFNLIYLGRQDATDLCLVCLQIIFQGFRRVGDAQEGVIEGSVLLQHGVCLNRVEEDIVIYLAYVLGLWTVGKSPSHAVDKFIGHIRVGVPIR